MIKEIFKQSLTKTSPPENIGDILLALWYDAKGDWKTAHELAQKHEGRPAYDRIHAYLHRKEGDDWNAQYWYNRIKLPFPKISLDEEWEDLVQEFTQK